MREPTLRRPAEGASLSPFVRGPATAEVDKAASSVVRVDPAAKRIVEVFTEEVGKLSQDNGLLLMLCGSSVQNAYKRNLSDIDVLGVFTKGESNLPYINLDRTREFTGAVRQTIKRLSDGGIYVVAVPQYTSGVWMIEAAKGKIAWKKGVPFDSVVPVELQCRLYTSMDHALITEERAALLKNILAGGRVLIGDQFKQPAIDYVAANRHIKGNDELTDDVLKARKMLDSHYVTHSTNIHLSNEALFKQALEVAKEVAVMLSEHHKKEFMLEGTITERDWAFALLHKHREIFPQVIRDFVELVHEQRELVDHKEAPTVTTEDLYRRTETMFNALIDAWSGLLLRRQFIVEKRD